MTRRLPARDPRTPLEGEVRGSTMSAWNQEPVPAGGSLSPVKLPLGGAVILLGGPGMIDESSEAIRSPCEVPRGDPERFGALLEQCRPRLRRMVALRLDPRLHGRIDPSDVIQETYLEASARLAEYLQKPTMPFFLWLRFLAGQKLVTLHRHHLGRQMRDAGREVALYRGGLPATTSA